MQRCTKCLMEKELDCFGKNKQRKSGIHTFCKQCCGNLSKKNRADNPIQWENTKEKNRKNYRLHKGIDLDAPARYKNKKGEPRLNWSGYMEMRGNKWKGHPCADKEGRVLVHRVVMYDHLKRPLNKEETIHHKNGNTCDNRIENLELWSSKHPPGYRVDDQISWCKEFLEQYGYEVNKKG